VRIINGYIFRAIITSTLLVLSVLLSLGAFIEFISQLDDIGTGAYGFWEALSYTGLKLPRFAGGVLPVSVLLGGLLGMGALATHSEMIVLRASGVSLLRIGRSAFYTGIVLAVVGALLTEYVSPPLDRYARQMKTLAKNSEVGISRGGSAWIRDGSLFFNINRADTGIGFGGVYIYNVNEAGNELVAIGRAQSADVDVFNDWQFFDYGETNFLPDSVKVYDEPHSVKPDSLNSDMLELTEVRTSSLGASELWRYIQYLKTNGLDAEEYEIAFWGRVSAVGGIAIMCVLAVPFVMGSLRSSGAGARMLVGVAIGLLYFLMNNTLKNSAEVFDLSPVLMGCLPTFILAVVTLGLIARTR